MPTHGMFCIIAICKGDWLHQSWGNAASLDQYPCSFGRGIKDQFAAGCTQGPWAIDSPKSRSIFRAKISRHFDDSIFCSKDASSRPLRTYTCKKNTQSYLVCFPLVVMTIRNNTLSLFQNVDRFSFSIFIVFAMHLDITYV